MAYEIKEEREISSFTAHCINPPRQEAAVKKAGGPFSREWVGLEGPHYFRVSIDGEELEGSWEISATVEEEAGYAYGYDAKMNDYHLHILIRKSAQEGQVSLDDDERAYVLRGAQVEGMRGDGHIDYICTKYTGSFSAPSIPVLLSSPVLVDRSDSGSTQEDPVDFSVLGGSRKIRIRE